jgi:hypothetical protein
MARGRLISRTLGTSRCYASLQQHAGKLAEFAQALYPLLVVFSDDHGREHGDAFTIKHAVWPTSPRSEADFHKALEAMVASRLIHRYAVDGVIYFQIRDFEAHQHGLHKRRDSKFPEFPGTSGNAPEILGRNEPETNRTEPELETNRTPAQREDDAPGDFAVFYAAYPRKKAKGDAEKAWKAAQITVAMMPDVLAAIAAQRNSTDWREAGGKFIPYPASWLRGKCWEDEVTRATRINGIEQQPDYRTADYECRHTPRCDSARIHQNALDMGRPEA